MQNLQKKTHENAASVPCELGGEMRRCLRVAMSDTEHTSKFGSSFAPCMHLGPQLACS